MNSGLLKKSTDGQYHECEHLYELERCNETIKGLNLLLEEKDLKICELVDRHVTDNNFNVETKKDNIYTDDARLCVIELAGLDSSCSGKSFTSYSSCTETPNKNWLAKS
ncbi:hypothetical protein DPMN_159936 [Dreissena polymorpha]|uniref:Uncharacterized protein n=1 Tax=Dreissena polymorpha TaxID=45954 RepID=A0A9D4EQ51_DREPO|nr:hypothetical protein DPMN_159936 [Dreissena polymorpha]